jgi:hypothetical protein
MFASKLIELYFPLLNFFTAHCLTRYIVLGIFLCAQQTQNLALLLPSHLFRVLRITKNQLIG